MGWLWSSPAAPPTQSPSPTEKPFLPNPEQSPPAPKPSLSQTDEDRELHAFLQEIEADASFSSTKHQNGPSPSAPRADFSHMQDPFSTLSKEPQQTQKKMRETTLEESLLPTEMSCRNAFDMAFYCQSLGGQFNNVFRYGEVRSCSEHWGAFWFCMRTKSMPGVQKEVRIQNHYKRRALKYKVGPSSEDVWESRDKKMEWGEAFSQSFDDEDDEEPITSEEWNRKEREKRAEWMRTGNVKRDDNR